MTTAIDLNKRRRKLNIEANDGQIEAATRRMKPSIERWIKKATERFATDEIRRLKARGRKKKKKISKRSIPLVKAAPSEFDLRRELERILVTFGIRDVDAAGEDMHDRLTARPDPTRWQVTPALVRLITRQKEAKIQQLTGQTKLRVRSQVRKILLDAEGERPRPSISEISRRIRVQIVELPPLRGARAPRLIARANRAELIARTESAQNENTGIVEGMAVAGIDEIEWLAHVDGRSGDRHHERMNGKRIPLADSQGSDRSKWFKLPSGARLRYPADPSGPIGEIARCRCTLLPVIRKGSRKLSPGRVKRGGTGSQKLHGDRSGSTGNF